MTKLTTSDLATALADERHLGYGYAESFYLSESKRERLDRSVVAVANELDLDYEHLFLWANSKYGRWLTDSVQGCGDSPSRATVRKLLNADALDVLRRGE